MKNKGKFLFILAFVIVSLFYRDNSVVAMAAEQNIEFVAKPDEEQNIESATEPDEEQNIDSIVDSAESEQNVESAAESQVEQNTESVCESESEQDIEPADESEPELIIEPNVASSMETTQDFVSTGPALIEWLESHKNTGGTVKLADHVVLEGYYCYCPDGVNRPSVFVDTDRYTITITGEIELMSDNHLTFSGQPDGRSIFYVSQKGMLSMLGVAVESGQGALWQEDGAGLVIEDCCISGSIHYADTPFVVDHDSVCVVVEKGQTVSDVLPAQISCTVNRQGQVSHNELVSITWNLEGCDKQQEERKRFRMQGMFLQAVSVKPVLGTVVYNDYPLTFMDVLAGVNDSMYLFRGCYTKPEGSLPITVISEYSFDGENWFVYEETTDAYAGFVIAIKSEQYDRAAHSNIYIRLRWNDNGSEYFSNVLCYATDDLEHVEDIGGGRGGGTSITNPPDQPQLTIADTSPENDVSADNANNSVNSSNTESEVPSDTNQTENGADNNSNAVSHGQAAFTEVSNADAGQTVHAESEAANAGQSSYTETKTDDSVRSTDNSDMKESINCSGSDILEKKEEAVAVSSVYGKNNANTPVINNQTLHSDIRQGNTIIIAAGFVLMAAGVGIVGFFVHSRLGTNR